MWQNHYQKNDFIFKQISFQKGSFFYRILCFHKIASPFGKNSLKTNWWWETS
jgi:hypothetical protein